MNIDHSGIKVEDIEGLLYDKLYDHGMRSGQDIQVFDRTGQMVWSTRVWRDYLFYPLRSSLAHWMANIVYRYTCYRAQQRQHS